MSADNYYVIRKHPKGGYAAVMGFASDQIVDGEWRDDIHPEAGPNDEQFDTVKAALDCAVHLWAEYGTDVHPECYQADPS